MKCSLDGKSSISFWEWFSGLRLKKQWECRFCGAQLKMKSLKSADYKSGLIFLALCLALFSLLFLGWRMTRDLLYYSFLFLTFFSFGFSIALLRYYVIGCEPETKGDSNG